MPSSLGQADHVPHGTSTLAHQPAFIQHLLAPGSKSSEQDRGGFCPHGAYTSRRMSQRDKPGEGQTAVRDVQRTDTTVTGWLLETGWSDQGKSLQGHLNDKIESPGQRLREEHPPSSRRPWVGTQLACPRDSKKASVAGAEGADRGGAGQGSTNILVGYGKVWLSF